MKYNETGFRAIYRHFCVVEMNANIYSLIKDLPGGDVANAVMTYGYYDREAGLTLEVLAPAVMMDGGFRCGDPYQDVSLKLRVSSLGETAFNVADDGDGVLSKKYADKLSELSAYDASEAIEETRMLDFLDTLRDEFFIDDVRVNLVLFECENEEVWVRINEVTEDKTFFGTLLNEPYQDFGVHEGDEIPFFLYKQDDGELVLVSDLIPTFTLKAEDLKDGQMLKKAVDTFCDNPSEKNFIEVLQLLRDSYVWVPFNAIMSEQDEERMIEMVKQADGDPEALVGQTFTNKDNIRMVPDILQRGDDYYLPAFSSVEEMGEFGEGFSKVERHFLEVIRLARGNERDLSGIVINAGSAGFILETRFFDAIEKMESRIDEE